MVRKQQGITLMSFIVVLVVVGFFAMVTMKLFPMYSEYHNVKSVMEEFAAQPNAAKMTLGEVQANLYRRFDMAYVSSVKNEHIKIVREGSRTSLNIAYEVRTDLFGNLDAVATFDRTIVLSGSGPGG